MKRIGVMAVIVLSLLTVVGVMSPAFAADAAETATAASEAADEKGPCIVTKLWDLFGVFHPATVHMPIALIIVAALFIVLRFKFERISPDVAFYTLILGAVSAVGATLMGFAFAPQLYSAGWFDMSSPDKETLFYHRWGGAVVTVMSVICAVLAVRSRVLFGDGVDADADDIEGMRKADVIWQVGTLATAALIGLVGHWGGHLTYGDLYTPRINAVLGIEEPEDEVVVPAPPPASDKIDFALHIAPIFEAHCLECHGAKKDKGGLRMHTKAAAFKGGDLAADAEDITNIVPGDADASFLVELLNPEFEDELMPPKKSGGPLKPEQIDLIKRWINEGAEWPDDLTLTEKK